ncbi:hypothetical protein PSTH1771_10895 [Pseudomonas syringae pv. theae]|uniref:Uncharacterized protein n=2 Tax=Pseudomonas syringae group TaxID=136849 RepID=A0A3M5MKD8_PSESX|nr:hypothetical protein ALO82_200162 [Pseudomonas syringae pv. broussonetiae]RMT23278.1 hypothetical protein ALP51_200022 [Pseudomonas savastanoi]RMT60497.1 hypothetical protein ALP44_200072 [Pseudomonas syringae pv. theae]GKQ31215.1 hypothetical protein PSTH68_16870 [Pseudomonas syringae pv. theae]GKQ48369.1 hypothetical protein PSTH2693_24455 [Pseudomonas syringae pv. theae]
MSMLRRAWDLAWKALQAFRLYEFLRDHFEDLM